MAQLVMDAFNEDAAKALSKALGEPQWLTDFRVGAARQFASLPTEKNALYTKYAFISAFDGSKFSISPAKSEVDFRSFFKGYLGGRETNIVLQGNETEVHTELDEDIRAKGVVLSTLHEALKSDEAAVRRAFLRKQVKSEGDKFAALANAFFNSGTFVHVPEGVEVGKPLRKMLLTDSPKTSVIEQTIIQSEANSRVVFLEELYSKGGGAPSLVASTAEVMAGPGSSVDFSSIQLLDEKAVHLANKAVTVQDSAKATVSTLSLGAEVSRSRLNYYLDGRGAVGEGFELFFTDAKQRYDFESNLVHNSPDSTGSTQARGVLKGESQSIFKGMIWIGPTAKNSKAYLAHHAMLLDRTAKSDGVPGLEILTNEVKATHSASVAQVDEEQLFYLMARGLPRDEAKKMLVLGFFEPVLSRVPIEQTREGAWFMLEGKCEGERRRLVDHEALVALTGEAMPEVRQTEDIFERHYKYR